MSYVFVTFTRDWADELDVYGFRIFTTKEWEDYQRLLKSCSSASVYFGTNEGWDDESGSDFLSDMNATVIDEDQAHFLIKLFSLDSAYILEWGVFPSENEFVDDSEDGDVIDDD